MSMYLISSESMHQQLRKEGRRNENEMQKLFASNQRLKKVNSCFLYDVINLLLSETTSFLFLFRCITSGQLFFLHFGSFMSGFTTKNRRSFHGYKTAKRAFRISKSFIA
jgi:hypothetical protein